MCRACGLRGPASPTSTRSPKPSATSAHPALNSAVLAAYGFSPKLEFLSHLLDLNLSLSTPERLARPTTPPGIPKSYADPAP